jgi:hypothetical protein
MEHTDTPGFAAASSSRSMIARAIASFVVQDESRRRILFTRTRPTADPVAMVRSATIALTQRHDLS